MPTLPAADEPGESSATTGAYPFGADSDWAPPSLRKHAILMGAMRRRATVSGPRPHRDSWDEARRDGTLTPPPERSSVSRASSAVNLALIEELLEDTMSETDTYDIHESRDGFFDAFFLKPPKIDYAELMEGVESTLPENMRPQNVFSVYRYLRRQWTGIQDAFTDAFETRAGLLTCKSFIAFYIAYFLCLSPPIRFWLGRYSYMMVVSTIINHPGRTIGSQIDGAVLTILGMAAGLGWGAVGLQLSTFTPWVYGVMLAVFLAIFMAFIAYLRSYFIRLYQLVLCAGMAICYTCLADVDGGKVKWAKIYEYAIPWGLGQAIAFVVCLCISPDAGALPMAEVFHKAFLAMDVSGTLFLTCRPVPLIPKVGRVHRSPF